MVNRNPVAEGILAILFAVVLAVKRFSLMRMPGYPVCSCLSCMSSFCLCFI
jgi:hypothetical protein